MSREDLNRVQKQSPLFGGRKCREDCWHYSRDSGGNARRMQVANEKYFSSTLWVIIFGGPCKLMLFPLNYTAIVKRSRRTLSQYNFRYIKLLLSLQLLCLQNILLIKCIFFLWLNCIALARNQFGKSLHMFGLGFCCVMSELAAAKSVNQFPCRWTNIIMCLQGQAVAQLCSTIPNVTVFGTASSFKHEAIKDSVTHLFDRNADYVQEVKR